MSDRHYIYFIRTAKKLKKYDEEVKYIYKIEFLSYYLIENKKI